MGQRFKAGLLSGLLVLTLSACSDDDDDKTMGFQSPSLSTSLITLDGTNNTEVANVAAESAATTSESGNNAGDVMLKAGSTGFNLVSHTKQLLNHYSTQGTSSPALFTYADTQNCTVSGTQSVSLTMDDSTLLFSHMSMSFNNCDEGSGEILNGSMSVKANAGHSNTTLDVTASYNNFRVTAAGATMAIHGGMSISEDGAGTSVISGSSLWMVDGASGESVHMQDFMLENTHDLSGNNTLNGYLTVDSSMLNGRIEVTYTNVYTANGDMYASGGTVVVTGANGATLTATILDASNVSLVLDINGDGTPEATDTVTWDQIAAATSNADVNATGGV